LYILLVSNHFWKTTISVTSK